MAGGGSESRTGCCVADGTGSSLEQEQEQLQLDLGDWNDQSWGSCRTCRTHRRRGWTGERVGKESPARHRYGYFAATGLSRKQP